jgi:CubicO group peptidase (beta-lactamase class C family)
MGEVHGSWAPGFEWVREAFARNLAEEEVGAACAVYQQGRLVVDLWGGWADREEEWPWERDTTALVFSSTKGLTATLVHRLAERGALDLDAPVARVWPEFAANGKGAITVRDVLTHRAGLAEVEGTFNLEEVLAGGPVCEAIAAQKPNWEPGTAHGYHVRSFGWILGEVVRRVTGQSFGQHFAAEAAKPLDLDFWIGLPEAEEHRVAKLYPAPEPSDPEQRALREKFMGPDTQLGRVLAGPSGLFSYGDMWNTRALHAAEMPSSNGIGTARALARFYAATVGEVDGVRLLSEETMRAASAARVEGPDRILLMPTRFASGFMLEPTLCPDAPEAAFGHPGAGGSLGFADPGKGIAFGYVMNQMQLGVVGDKRAERLVSATYACLSATATRASVGA